MSNTRKCNKCGERKHKRLCDYILDFSDRKRYICRSCLGCDDIVPWLRKFINKVKYKMKEKQE